MRQVINLRKFLGRSPTPQERSRFARQAINFVVERTLDGFEVGGKATFTPYSESYAAKKGVTEDSVDLFLDGDMLGSIEIDNDADGDFVGIRIPDSLQSKKAFNHDTGDTLPKRQFFGLTVDEVETIVQEFPRDRVAPTQTGGPGFTLADLRTALQTIGITQED